jgi:hypothetical protein
MRVIACKLSGELMVLNESGNVIIMVPSKYNHLFRACALFLQFLHQQKMDLGTKLCVTMMIFLKIMVGLVIIS